MSEAPESEEQRSVRREATALFALVVAIAWITLAYTRAPDSPKVPLLHPMVAIGLLFVLLPFRRGVVCRRGIIVASAMIGFWLAARLSIAWVPFLTAFILAYVLRFVSRELQVIHLPGGRTLRLSRTVANAMIAAGFVGTVLLFAFVVTPAVIAQVVQLATGARVAYRKTVLYRIEEANIETIRAQLDEPTDGGPILLGSDVVPAAETLVATGTPITPDLIDRLEAAGVSSVPIQIDPYAMVWYEEWEWIRAIQGIVEEQLPQEFTAPIIASLQSRIGTVSSAIGSVFTRTLGFSTQLISGMVGFVATLVFTIIVLTYLLRAYDNYLEAALLALPFDSWDRARRMARGVDRNMQAFLRGQAFIIIAIAALSTAAYRLAGIPFALLLGIIGGLLNTIPNVGPALAGIVAFFALILGSVTGIQPDILFFIGSTGMRGFLVRAALIPVAIFTVQSLDNAFVSPRVMSRAVNIDPLLIMAAVLTGGALFGFWGVLLAIPGLVIVKSMWENSGARPPESTTEPARIYEDEKGSLDELF